MKSKTDTKIQHKRKILTSFQDNIEYSKFFASPLKHTNSVHDQKSRRTVLFLLALLTLSVAVLWRIDSINVLLESGETSSSTERLSFMLIFMSIYFASSVLALIIKNVFFRKTNIYVDLMVVLIVISVLLPLSLFYSLQINMYVLLLFTTIVLLLTGRIMFRSYSFAGINFYLASSLGVIVGLVWGLNFFVIMEAGLITRILILSSMPILVVSLPSSLLHLFELYDVVCRDHWRRPMHPFPENWHKYTPFVSIHVPTYSEPPEIVIETLNKIAAVDYSNFEVILIDNNTKDKKLWMPVEEHCKKLGPKFRFIHKEGLKGAKAGALNYIHKYINSKTEVIAVIDADYQVDRLFLKSLVGYFQNSKVGFVQTPHDYRDWQNNLFMTMCYWEYKLFFHTAMISLNERDAGITVGTMCLVRKEALEKVGGWSEWCVTEDSELAIRIHDAGYTSVYVGKTFGKGLIPDNFEDYKKQRYRWTAGPVQEFRHYYKHFVGVSKEYTNFNLSQRIFHLNHGLGNTLSALNIPMLIISIATIASLIINNEIIQIPFELWLAATITLITTPLLVILLYRVTIKAKLSDILAQAVAATALSHVVAISALRTAITGSTKWDRTNKFKSNHSYLYALYSTKEEVIIGMSLLVFILTAYLVFPYKGLSMMLIIGVLYVSISYFAAPAMALVGVWSNRRDDKFHKHSHELIHPD